MAAPVSRQPSVVGPALVPLGDYASKPPIALARPVIVIGSRSNCRIHLISSTVSKAHSLLVLTETGCYIADLASRTKTIVNGKPVRECELEDGDTLQIGKFPFRFVGGRVRPVGRFPPAPAASLLSEDSPLPVPIDRKVVLIGRRRSADLPLLEESVSTAHAVILERDGKRYLRDLGSRTGTFINGRKIHQEELRSGDVIRIGETELRYQLDEPSKLEEPELTKPPTPARIRPAAPLSPAIAPTVVERVPAIETLATPVEEEPPTPTKAPPLIVEASAIEQAPPTPESLADTAIPIAVDEHDEFAVIDLEPSGPATPPEPSVTEQVATLPVAEPASEMEVAPGEETVDELSPRRGWRGVVEPEAPVEQVVAEALEVAGIEWQSDGGTEALRGGAETERRRDEETEPIAPVGLDEPRPSGSGLESVEVEAGIERRRDEGTEGLRGGAETERPLAPSEVEASDEATEPPDALPSPEATEIPRFARDDERGEPIASGEPRPSGSGLESVGVEAGIERRRDDGTEALRGGAETERPRDEETAVAQAPSEPEIDLSAFTPVPIADTDADTEEPSEAPKPLLSLDEPPSVPGTIALIEPPAEIIEPTVPEPESALPAVELPGVEASAAELSEPLSDSAFASQVEWFAEAGGEVVAEESGEGTEGRREEVETERPRDEETEPIAPVGLDEPRPSGSGLESEEVAPLALASEPMVAAVDELDSRVRGNDEKGDIAPVALEEPVARSEPIEEVPTPLDTISGDDDALLAERQQADLVTADVPSVAPIEPSPSTSVDVFGWSSDQDTFLGGAPLTLPPSVSAESDSELAPVPSEEVEERQSGQEESPAMNETPPTEAPTSESVERATTERKKLRGSQRRRRSLRRHEEDGASAVEEASAFLSETPVAPSSVDVFSQVPAVDADALLAGAGVEAAESQAIEPPVKPADEPVPPRPLARPRPTPRSVAPAFAQDPAGLAMVGRSIRAATLDPDEHAAAARLVSARRRRLRLVPLLLVLMALLIGGTVWGIYHFVPVIGRVEVSVRFRNIDGLPNEARRREFREQQRQRLGSLPVRQAALVNLAGYATPELQVSPGFLEDPVEYDRVASGAQWVERGDWALRISRRSEDLRGDSWRLRAMGDALQQSNRALLDDARRLRGDVERLDADITRSSARRSELRQLIDAERSLGDGKRQLELALQKLESELDALETRWAEQSRQVTALQAELALLQTAPPSAPAPDLSAPADAELAALQQQLDQVNEALQKSRAAGQQAATQARQSFEAAVARFQSDLQDVQNTLDASPELKAYVESAQGLLEVTRRLTEDLIHRQQQHYDRLQTFKLRLEEQAQTRRVEQWQNDRVLRDLGEQLAYAQRQLNVATANGLEAEATDARLQIKLLEEKIARRQEELGADPLAVSAIMQLQEIIDFAAKAMAEDRARQEKVFEENTRILKQAAIARLPAEQQELARKLEARMSEINAARREFAAALSNETTQPADDAQELAKLQTSASELAGRIEARRKQLAEANAAQFTAQQEQKRQEQVRAKESELVSARLKVAELQEQLSAKHRERRDVARRVSDASLAGERLVQRQQELEQVEQLLEVWRRTRDVKQSELGACVEPLAVSDLDIDLQEGRDQRWVYAASAGGGLFVLFGLLIGATIRGALHDIPSPDLPMRSSSATARLGRPATAEPVEKSDEDARPAAT